MNAFLPRINDKKNSLRIIDSRYSEFVDITDGSDRFGELAYTLLSEDMNKTPATPGMPYAQKTVGYDSTVADKNGDFLFENYNFKTQTKVTFKEKYMSLNMRCESADVSEWGIYLPFNMTNQTTGDWRNQAVPATVYHTADQKKWFCYLTRPDGKIYLVYAKMILTALKLTIRDLKYRQFAFCILSIEP